MRDGTGDVTWQIDWRNAEARTGDEDGNSWRRLKSCSISVVYTYTDRWLAVECGTWIYCSPNQLHMVIHFGTETQYVQSHTTKSLWTELNWTVDLLASQKYTSTMQWRTSEVTITVDAKWRDW